MVRIEAVDVVYIRYRDIFLNIIMIAPPLLPCSDIVTYLPAKSDMQEKRFELDVHHWAPDEEASTSIERVAESC